MNESFITTIGYHDGDFEVEIIIDMNSKTKDEAENIGRASAFHRALFYAEKIVVNDMLVIQKTSIENYQFRVCRQWKPIVSAVDYDCITWDEAVKYLKLKREIDLPFLLESYYFRVYEQGENLFS